MNDPNSHIIHYLDLFLSRESEDFDLIFEKIEDEQKSSFRKFLLYLNNLVDDLLDLNSKNGLKFSHIHLPGLSQWRNIVLEFMIIKLYVKTASSQINADTSDLYINHVSSVISKELGSSIRLNTNEGKRDLAKKRAERKKLKRLNWDFKLLQELGFDTRRENYRPKWLFHLLVKDYNFLVDRYSPSAFFIELSNIIGKGKLTFMSYLLINSHKSLNDLDSFDLEEKSILEYIENILLFDCTSRRANQQFNYFNLSRFNREGLSFRNLMIITFDEKPFRLNRLISGLSDVSTRYYERPSGLNFQSYVTFPAELGALLENVPDKQVEVNFVTSDDLIWANFQDLIHDHENLYELISIKMRNIYSLSFSDQLKELIIEDIFLVDKTPIFLSEETKAELFRLNDEDILRIKLALEDVLDIVIQLNISSRIENLMSKTETNIVVPFHALNSRDVIDLLKKQFPNSIFITWKEVTYVTKGDIIVLDYRDSGRFPYSIYPNLFESKFSSTQDPKGMFLAMFFKRNYDHAFFEYNQTLFEKVGQHRIRQEKFNWQALIQQLRLNKPENKIDSYLWDLDNSYNSSGERELVRIKFSSGNPRSFYPSQLFIAKVEGDEHYFPVRADEITDYIVENAISVQPLDELYKDINLFEASDEEEREVYQLKKHYDLTGEEQGHRLWKILLKRKCDAIGSDSVYIQIEKLLSDIGITMIKRSYFENFWVNIRSDSLIPRSKRTFKILCDFLDLPDVYFRIMLKKRASEKLATRVSTIKMNDLLAGLMEKGMFDDATCELAFDETFINKHDLDELWFNIENLSTELRSLVDLLKPNIELVKVVNAKFKAI
ncbi:hypothetical protein [Gaoshiqia sediminis]|uniref:Uncharacterized protein n=1 Tax=Gaoshiqia sediminis TaxID=2986998 RepID=A0AA42C5A5_9BACT|nr:hypothetical protein [Gaoshiqia sediminis]MCW0481354.1 hypothetical protein [Gaoshiqia sediminis]